jgi:purine nucleoside phosphorylase
VLAISWITNLAAGRASKGLSHEDVLSKGQKVKGKARLLLETFVKMYAEFAQKAFKAN